MNGTLMWNMRGIKEDSTTDGEISSWWTTMPSYKQSFKHSTGKLSEERAEATVLIMALLVIPLWWIFHKNGRHLCDTPPAPRAGSPFFMYCV